MQPAKPIERLQESLRQVSALLERHRVLEAMTHRQEGPKRELLEQLQHRQNLAELRARLAGLHPADAAYILESLPVGDRLLVWTQVEPARAGHVLLELSDAVRDGLVEATPGRRCSRRSRASTPTTSPTSPRSCPRRCGRTCTAPSTRNSSPSSAPPGSIFPTRWARS